MHIEKNLFYPVRHFQDNEGVEAYDIKMHGEFTIEDKNSNSTQTR